MTSLKYQFPSVVEIFLPQKNKSILRFHLFISKLKFSNVVFYLYLSDELTECQENFNSCDQILLR